LYEDDEKEVIAVEEVVPVFWNSLEDASRNVSRAHESTAR
jgi:hypothetical protein